MEKKWKTAYEVVKNNKEYTFKTKFDGEILVLTRCDTWKNFVQLIWKNVVLDESEIFGTDQQEMFFKDFFEWSEAVVKLINNLKGKS